MTSKYFKIYELVPEHIYKRLGEKAWKLLNPNMIKTIDAIKERFPEGTMTINNYHWNGNRNWSGLRTPGSPEYSETSQHSLGNAFDAVFSAYTAEEVRVYVIANPKEFPYLKGIETNISWFHGDVRNTDNIELFNK